MIFYGGCIAATIEWKSFFACSEAKKIGMNSPHSAALTGTDPDIYRQDVRAAQNILITFLVLPFIPTKFACIIIIQ